MFNMARKVSGLNACYHLAAASTGVLSVHDVYSDSLSDLPMLRLADKAYIVKRRKVMPLAQYEQLSRIRRMFV